MHSCIGYFFSFSFLKETFAETFHTFSECSKCFRALLGRWCWGATCGLTISLFCWLVSPRPQFVWIVFISLRSCWIIDWSSFIPCSPLLSKCCKLNIMHGLLCYLKLELAGSVNCLFLSDNYHFHRCIIICCFSETLVPSALLYSHYMSFIFC